MTIEEGEANAKQKDLITITTNKVGVAQLETTITATAAATIIITTIII